MTHPSANYVLWVFLSPVCFTILTQYLTPLLPAVQPSPLTNYPEITPQIGVYNCSFGNDKWLSLDELKKLFKACSSGQVICTSFVLDNKQYIHVDLYVCQTNNNIIAMVALQKTACF